MRKILSITLRHLTVTVGPIVAILIVLGSTGCDENTEQPVFLDLPPSAPDGVFSVTGDGQVEICWNSNPEDDIAGYDVYWNDEELGFYEYVASVGPSETCYIDTDVTNGVTYYYAVLAVDGVGQESDLSYVTIFDTPRPEGTNLVLFEFDYLGQNGSLSGYDFSGLSGTPQDWMLSSTDVYFDAPNGVPTLFSKGAGVDVQDYGFIELIYVDWAPFGGWSNVGQVELIQGHSYVIRISDGGGGMNYAKLYCVAASASSCTLDWAYQFDTDNPELTPGIGGAQQ